MSQVALEVCVDSVDAVRAAIGMVKNSFFNFFIFLYYQHSFISKYFDVKYTDSIIRALEQ